MNYTENHKLCQWEAGDPIRRADFNADNAAIDAAIKAVEQNAASALAAYQRTTDAKLTDLSADRICFGSWVGDDTTYRSIQLPFAPKILLVMGHYYNSTLYGMLLVGTQEITYYVRGSNCNVSSADAGGVLSGDVFQMGKYSSYNNYSGATSYYVAIK